ncbi:MAG TPA: hypothetical protein VGE05_01005 [Novosphingobium sp.]
MSGRSKLLVTVGAFLALAGAVYFVSPTRNPDTGLPERDAFTLLASAWLIASGVGLILHKSWALWLYLAGTAICFAFVVVKAFGSNGNIADAAVGGLIGGAVFGVPALVVWFRRDRLRTDQQESLDA